MPAEYFSERVVHTIRTITYQQMAEINETFIIVNNQEHLRELSALEGFYNNSSLILSEPFLTKYGRNAYFVSEKWLSNYYPIETEIEPIDFNFE